MTKKLDVLALRAAAAPADIGFPRGCPWRFSPWSFPGLEADGLINVQRTPAGNPKWVAITPAGEAALAEGLERHRSAREHWATYRAGCAAKRARQRAFDRASLARRATAQIGDDACATVGDPLAWERGRAADRDDAEGATRAQ